MSKFKVGEVAIVVNADYHKNHIGRECEIICVNPVTLSGAPRDYEISIKGIRAPALTNGWYTHESHLRKKKPPQETSTWEEVQEIVGWNPSKMSEELR